jgi:hypothetical protein
MRYDEIGRRLHGRYPALHRLALVPWRLIRDLVPVSAGYWERRRRMAYYSEVVRLARKWEPGGGRVIDVGAGPTRLLSRLDWFAERVALDRNWIPRQPGVQRLRAEYEAPRPFALVLCLQVLEHLGDPAPFARKLLVTGRTVIVSVPYRWPAGLSPGHVQDPVDEAKLARWMGREPADSCVVHDERPRLIAVYRTLSASFSASRNSLDSPRVPE